MSSTSTNTEKIVQQLKGLNDKLNNNKLFNSLRSTAIDRLAEEGLPKTKNESYKYSKPDHLFKDATIVIPEKHTTSVANKNSFLFSNSKAIVIVLVNGIPDFANSTLDLVPKGMTIDTLSSAVEKNIPAAIQYLSKLSSVSSDPIARINSGMLSEGLFIHVSENCTIETPVHIISITNAGPNLFMSTAALIVVEKNASLEIVETLESTLKQEKATFNQTSEIFVKENAHVKFYKLQNNSSVCNVVTHTFADVASNAHFDTHTVTFGCNWVRNNLAISISGTGADVHLNGLFIADENRHIDNHTVVNHGVPHGQSYQTYKGILNDKATGVFNGKIIVQRDAQKTNAYQSSKNILLSDFASINTKPELEIYADDVKCSHGSSTGRIDPEALFYLRSRGVGEESARKLLMIAFAADVLSTIRIGFVKDAVMEQMQERLIQMK